MLQQKNESVKFKNFIKEVRNDNKRHNYCYERYSPVALPLPICHRIMKKPAYKHEVFRQDAVLAPQEPYSEKFRKGTTDIETECLKRRAHFVGVQAGAVAFAGAFGATAIQAFSDIANPRPPYFRSISNSSFSILTRSGLINSCVISTGISFRSGIIFVAIRCAYLYWRKNSSVSKSKGGHPQLQPKLGHFSHSSMKRASSRKRSMYSSTPISAVKYSIVYSVVTTVLL